MTTEEELAIAVLRGDRLAAKALADMVLENHVAGTEVPPIQDLPFSLHGPIERQNLRIVLYANSEVEWNRQGVNEAISEWLYGSPSQPLLLTGVNRMEIYRLKEEDFEVPHAKRGMIVPIMPDDDDPLPLPRTIHHASDSGDS